MVLCFEWHSNFAQKEFIAKGKNHLQKQLNMKCSRDHLVNLKKAKNSWENEKATKKETDDLL